MNEIFFPKPTPAEPLPLEGWLRRVDRAGSNREAFFRGRDKEFEMFRSAVLSLNDGSVGGGTMVFQGPPGVGKTALMNECMEAVREHSTLEAPWLAVSIGSRFLNSPLDIIGIMVDAANSELERIQKMASEGIETMVMDDLLKVGEMLKKDLAKRGHSDDKVSIRQVFRRASLLLLMFRVVVFVDEAQNIPVTDTVSGVLDCLHRDFLEVPLLTVFFGLSDTQRVLGECELSRLSDDRLVNLEPLPLEDAVCSIHSVFDTYDFTGSPEDRQAWAEQLAEMSDGWPQLINRVSVAAARVIHEDGGQIKKSRLDQALKIGRERINSYFYQRLDAGSSWDWVYRELALESMDYSHGYLSWDDVDSITEPSRARSGESTNVFLNNALHAGLLIPAPRRREHYKIPIPSLGEYLRSLQTKPPWWADS